MDFAFSEEQQMLRDSVREFMADKIPPEKVVELAESDAGWDESSWSQICQLGWVGLSAPEAVGGAGMTFVDEAVVLEELGYGLYPGPYFSTVGLALPALAGDPDLLSRVVEGQASATLAYAEPSGPHTLRELDTVSTKAERSNGSWKLVGEKHLVPDLGSATHAVVVARASDGMGLWAVELESAERQVLSTMDPTRPLGRLVLNESPATLLVEPNEAGEVIARIRLRALAGLAVEATGVAQRALDLANAYTKERKQFDKPIGTYQAVSHQVANTYADTELARSVAYWAAWCVAEGDTQAEVAASAAKALAAESAVAACERAIQVHGGIGFTWEHILHRFYKRAEWIESFDGYGGTHRAAVARALLDD